VGIPELCPPLASWPQMQDGTLDLVDVLHMHSVMDELIHQSEKAQSNG